MKGLEPKFGNFVTKAAVIPEATAEAAVEEEAKVTTKKETKKEPKKESAGLSPAETKDRFVNGRDTAAHQAWVKHL